jgi:hypothetical protein
VRFGEQPQPVYVNPVNHEQVEGLDEELRDLLLRRVGTRNIDSESLGLKSAAVAKGNGGIELGAELLR